MMELSSTSSPTTALMKAEDFLITTPEFMNLQTQILKDRSIDRGTTMQDQELDMKVSFARLSLQSVVTVLTSRSLFLEEGAVESPVTVEIKPQQKKPRSKQKRHFDTSRMTNAEQ
jgi:hypothetical protein